MNAHAVAFARENACLHSQWNAFVYVLSDALTRMTGEAWTPGDHDELHVGPHSATWTIARGDGFRLKVSAHGKRGVATMVRHGEPGDVTANGLAPAPLMMTLPIHHFDRFGDTNAIAEDLIALVIEPSEPLHAKVLDMKAKRERLGRQLEANSRSLADTLASAAADPQDRSGRSHLVTNGHVFGRIRLGRGGSGIVELSGLSHAAILAIATIVAGSAAEGNA